MNREQLNQAIRSDLTPRDKFKHVLRAYCNRNQVTIHIHMIDAELWAGTLFTTSLLDDTTGEATMAAVFDSKITAAEVCASIVAIRNGIES